MKSIRENELDRQYCNNIYRKYYLRMRELDIIIIVESKIYAYDRCKMSLKFRDILNINKNLRKTIITQYILEDSMKWYVPFGYMISQMNI